MTTGRKLAEMALREPMRSIGWQPRAAGWFTRQIAVGFLGVSAVGSASRYSDPGTAEIMLYVGIRDEATERVVSRLCDLNDDVYRQRTASTPIGYLLPDNRWRDWHVTPATAVEVAGELAALVERHGEPYLHWTNCGHELIPLPFRNERWPIVSAIGLIPIRSRGTSRGVLSHR